MSTGQYADLKRQDLVDGYRQIVLEVRELFNLRNSDEVDRRLNVIHKRLYRDDMTFAEVLIAGQYCLAITTLHTTRTDEAAKWKRQSLIGRFDEIASQVLGLYTQQQIHRS